MIITSTTQVIRAEPDEILEFVMDIERYAQVDDKIRPVYWARRDGDVTEFACRSKVGGVPDPKVRQELRLTPGHRIDIALSAPPANRLARAMAEFQSSFECVPADGGTRVNRTLRFRLKWPATWILGPVLRRRLPAQVEQEIQLAKEYLERSTHRAGEVRCGEQATGATS